MGTIDAADEPAQLDGDVVSYDMTTGIVTAEGNVLMQRGATKVAGGKAVYNVNTKQGQVLAGDTGRVIVVREDFRMTAAQIDVPDERNIIASGGVVIDRSTTGLHMTASRVTAIDTNQFIAEGDVHATEADKSFAGAKAEYRDKEGYVLAESGGTITTADGTFTADHIEGWFKEDHFKGIGNVHVISPPRDFEGGGDVADYYGKGDKPMAVLDGNAWAVQANNTVNSGHITVYLAESGKAQAAPAQ
jgi:lipopolysaccharide export system protein LptA